MIGLIFRLITRPIRTLLLLGVIYLIFFAGAADARGAFAHGYKEELSFVAPTDIQAPNGSTMSLCRLTRQNHLTFIPSSRKSLGYVLSDQNCQTDAGYYAFDDAGFAEAQAAGLIHRAIPASPRMGVGELVMGHLFWLLVSLAVIALGLVVLNRRRLLRVRREILAIEDPAVFNFIDAMCHAARADGSTAPEEITFIRDLARDLTGLDYTPEHIEQAIAHCPILSGPIQFRRFGKGLNVKQRQLILHGALSVVAADGQMTKSEKAFIGYMAKGMKLKRQEMDAVIAQFFARINRQSSAAPA